MPYCKAVPISSLTSVRKVTIFWIPSNHDLTRLRVERQPRLFKVVTRCSLSQSDRLSAVTNRWAPHFDIPFYISLVKIAPKRVWSISCYLGQFWDNSLSWYKKRRGTPGPPQPFPQNKIENVFDIRIPQFRIQWLVLWIHSLAQNARQNSDEASNWQRLPHERAPEKSRTDRQEGS